jgi:hypothetical protein
MSVLDVSQGVNKALDEIEAQGAELQSQFDALQTRRMMSSELNSLNAQLELLDARTKRQVDKLSVYAGDLEALATRNAADIEVWTRALRAARGAHVPKSARNRTASILKGVPPQNPVDRTIVDVSARGVTFAIIAAHVSRRTRF